MSQQSRYNNTTQPLSAGATFTGKAEETGVYNGIAVMCKATTNCRLYIEFGIDPNNFDYSKLLNVTANSTLTCITQILNSWFRLRLINDGADQGTNGLRLSSRLVSNLPNNATIDEGGSTDITQTSSSMKIQGTTSSENVDILADDDGRLQVALYGSDDGEPTAVAVDSTGKVEIVGSFTATNDEATSSIQIYGYDGSDNQAIKTDTSGRVNTLLYGNDDGTTRAVAVDSTGKVEIVGSFTATNDEATSSIQIYGYDGTDNQPIKTDTSGRVNTLLYGDDDGTTRAVAVDSTGKIEVATSNDQATSSIQVFGNDGDNNTGTNRAIRTDSVGVVQTNVNNQISGFATETTLGTVNTAVVALNGKVTACDTDDVTISNQISGFATETTLGTVNTAVVALNGKVTACNTNSISGSVTATIGQAASSIQVYGYDGTDNQAIKTDTSGRVNTLLYGDDGGTATAIAVDSNGKVDVTVSNLFATESTLSDVDTKLNTISGNIITCNTGSISGSVTATISETSSSIQLYGNDGDAGVGDNVAIKTDDVGRVNTLLYGIDGVNTRAITVDGDGKVEVAVSNLFATETTLVSVDGTLDSLDGKIDACNTNSISGSVTATIGQAASSIQVYGYDGTDNQAIKTDTSGRVNALLYGIDGVNTRAITVDGDGKVDVTVSNLFATESTLGNVDTKLGTVNTTLGSINTNIVTCNTSSISGSVTATISETSSSIQLYGNDGDAGVGNNRAIKTDAVGRINTLLYGIDGANTRAVAVDADGKVEITGSFSASNDESTSSIQVFGNDGDNNTGTNRAIRTDSVGVVQTNVNNQISGFATETTLGTLATQATLSTLNDKVTACDTTNLATQATLSTLNDKVTACDTTNLATQATLSNLYDYTYVNDLRYLRRQEKCFVATNGFSSASVTDTNVLALSNPSGSGKVLYVYRTITFYDSDGTGDSTSRYTLRIANNAPSSGSTGDINNLVIGSSATSSADFYTQGFTITGDSVYIYLHVNDEPGNKVNDITNTFTEAIEIRAGWTLFLEFTGTNDSGNLRGGGTLFWVELDDTDNYPAL